MRAVILVAMVLLAAGAAHAQLPEHLTFNSPGGKWQVVARLHQRTPSHLQDGYTYELRDRRDGNIYFAQQWEDARSVNDSAPETSVSVEPRELSVLWNSDGRRAAISCFYGRALEDINVIDISGRSPSNYKLTVENLFGPRDFSLVRAKRWLNRRDLVVEASLPAPAMQDAKGPTAYTLLVRCARGGYTIVKKRPI